MPRRVHAFLIIPLGALAAWPAQAQRLGGDSGVPISLARVLAALIVCLAAAFALALLIKRRSGGLPRRLGQILKFSQGRRIRLIEARRLSLSADLVLVQCDGTEYLVLCSSAALQVLERRELPPVEAPQ